MDCFVGGIAAGTFCIGVFGFGVMWVFCTLGFGFVCFRFVLVAFVDSWLCLICLGLWIVVLVGGTLDGFALC